MYNYMKLCQMSKSKTAGLWMRFTKNYRDMFTPNELSFEVIYEGHPNSSKTFYQQSDDIL